MYQIKKFDQKKPSADFLEDLPWKGQKVADPIKKRYFILCVL
jgi:hypothetical protein